MDMAKVTVIGAGHVGASLAELIAMRGLADVALFDIVEGIPQGKALDMAEACPLWGSSSRVVGTNSYDDTRDSDVVVITAGLARKPGMSRDDLLAANAKIVRGVTEEVVKLSPDCVIIVVTNPMDVMAHLARNVSGFAAERVIGMGGVLDSARFRTFVAWEAGVSVRDVEALVLGGHGDQMVPMPRFTTVKGVPITELFPQERIKALIDRTKNGGAEIVAHLKTGSAYYAPAASAFEMVSSIIRNERRMLPCAVRLNGEYGISGVYSGVPVVLGRGGLVRIVELKLTDEEQNLLNASAEAVRKLTESISR
jgi:malate dehydrogenase